MAAPRFLTRVAGIISDIAAAVTSTPNALVGTNASGLIDISFFPAGMGADTVSVVATEAISAGAMVNLYTVSTTCQARNADAATAAAGKPAHGFTLSAIASGATGTIYRSGQNTSLTGLTAGSDYYLGASGAVSATPNTTSGQTSQYIGKAISTTDLDVQIQAPIGVV